ncbi:MAG: 3'(2'),5'-bisphosphate nucleotidase CysQ [Chloroflexota bacterium]|nr:3'(2'),5'-bisphosphate nucleotidase CysQ [Chloroflexota bacterium]
MSEPTSAYARELDVAIIAATGAGRIVRDYYDAASARTYEKGDGSLVTDADLASDRLIRDILAAHFPDDPILTEEGQDDPGRLTHARCWIADPIDGTEQFIQRTDDFDVLIALAVNGRPVVAAGVNPPTGLLCAAEHGQGAWLRDPAERALQPFSLQPRDDGDPARLATSVWFGAPGNAPLVAAVRRRFSSSRQEALKIGFTPRIFLPSRAIDAYLGIRTGDDQAMGWEWDFATADLFIHEAGGLVTDLSGEPFRYNKPLPRNTNGLVAARDPATHQRLLSAVRTELPSRRGAD